MVEDDLKQFDDGLPWGYRDPEIGWIELPKLPMMRAGLGPPPFDVTMSDGQVRHIVRKPVSLPFTDGWCAQIMSTLGRINPYSMQTQYRSALEWEAGWDARSRALAEQLPLPYDPVVITKRAV